jgi:hypothetical protein
MRNFLSREVPVRSDKVRFVGKEAVEILKCGFQRDAGIQEQNNDGIKQHVP